MNGLGKHWCQQDAPVCFAVGMGTFVFVKPRQKTGLEANGFRAAKGQFEHQWMQKPGHMVSKQKPQLRWNTVRSGGAVPFGL